MFDPCWPFLAGCTIMKFHELHAEGVAVTAPQASSPGCQLCKQLEVNIFSPYEHFKRNITFLYRQRGLFFFSAELPLVLGAREKKKELDQENVYFFGEPRSVIEPTFVRLIPRLFESVEVTGNLYTVWQGSASSVYLHYADVLQTTAAHVNEAMRSVVPRVDGSAGLDRGIVACGRQSSRCKRCNIVLHSWKTWT